MTITPEQLQRIFPALTNAAAVCAALNPALERYAINTPARLAAFIAQCGHESGGFSTRRENLNYSAKGLLATWPSRFNPTTAAALARKPQAIANRVYGGRMGNVQPDDGWRYRGGGFIQLTGRDAYRKAGAAIGLPLESEPELIERLDVAALTACWYWSVNRLNSLADDLTDDDDDADFEAITRKINGGTTGLAERRALWKMAKGVLG